MRCDAAHTRRVDVLRQAAVARVRVGAQAEGEAGHCAGAQQGVRVPVSASPATRGSRRRARAARSLARSTRLGRCAARLCRCCRCFGSGSWLMRLDTLCVVFLSLRPRLCEGVLRRPAQLSIDLHAFILRELLQFHVRRNPAKPEATVVKLCRVAGDRSACRGRCCDSDRQLESSMRVRACWLLVAGQRRAVGRSLGSACSRGRRARVPSSISRWAMVTTAGENP